MLSLLNTLRAAPAVAGLLAALAAAPASAVQIVFDNFATGSSQALLQRNGNATFVNGALRLTPDEQSQVGSAFLKQGLQIGRDADFSTSFRFRIDSVRPGIDRRADGLAFVIQGGGSDFIGGSGSDLGYMEPNTLGGGYFYAVEFDTFEPDNPSASHVAVTRTDANGTTVIGRQFTTALPLDNGQIKNVHLEYGEFGIERRLQVSLSEDGGGGGTSFAVVLPDDLFHFGGDSTFVGFTGATGDRFASHDILSWTFALPEPGMLPLVAIGAIAMLGIRRVRPYRWRQA